MNCLEKELADTRKNSDETVAETSCDAHRQISEMEDKVYAKTDKEYDTRRGRRQQEA